MACGLASGRFVFVREFFEVERQRSVLYNPGEFQGCSGLRSGFADSTVCLQDRRANVANPLLNPSSVRQFGSGRPLVVIAIGGNAMMRPEDDGSLGQQYKRAVEVAKVLHGLCKRGYRVMLVHGNGPQVGQELIRSEEASTKVPLASLDACVASTQGTMGYQLELALYNQSHALRVATVLTLVEVAADDPGFKTPTKPVGPFFTALRARDLAKHNKWQMTEDSGRGWRKVVASPKPIGVVNIGAIDAAMSRMDIVIAGGGGGVPVIRDSNGRMSGVEAVIDKDLTSALLGQLLGAQMMVVLTAVDHVSVDFGKPTQRRIDQMTVAQARLFLEQGQFPAGSMGPKVQAAVDFARTTGRPAAIGAVGQVARVLAGQAGTRVVAD